jgi:adenine-specific DNA methylase
VAKHDLLYIDPPYNFRQYSAYYHFINFVSAYAFLPDVGEYLNDIKFVRGQNMVDDFASDFCFADRFVDALQNLIDNGKSKYVVMSYYGGRNHWNHWSKEGELNDIGFQKISAVFKDHKLFKSYRAEKLSQKRQNYQSRVGEKKEKIEEYLFFGERQKYSGKVTSQKEQSLLSEPNCILKLDFFQPAYQREWVAGS